MLGKLYQWLIVAMMCLFTGVASMAAPAPKPEVRVYIAQEESSKRVLENMLDMLGLRLANAPIPNRPVSGKFEFSSAEDVMAYFRSSFRINWFQNGTQIYVYRSDDWKTQKIYVGSQKTNEDWKDILTASGLYYKEFPFAVSPDGKEIILSGPRSYIKLVSDVFKQTPPDPSEIAKHGIDLMVFPLRHASVEDRQTVLRGVTLTTPGVLSVLLNLLGLPNQKMTASPESKKAGMVADGGGNQPSGMGLVQSPSAPARMGSTAASMNGSLSSNEEKPKEELPLSVTADPRTNSILIRDAKSKYDYYRDLVEKLDKPVQMIEVEAMLLEVTQNGLNQLGLEFGFQSQNFLYDFPGSGVSAPSLIPPGSTSIVDPSRFVARLKALSADENAKVLARPTIVTQDNVSAYIDLSQTLYLQLTGERVANVVPVTAGSLLQVTPRIVRDSGEEKVFVRLDIQDGSISQNAAGTSVGPPTVQNTSLSTQAIVQREKALLVGGYNRESASDKDYRIPFLSNLPLIGKIFTSAEKRSQNMVRLFLITPRMIEDPVHNSTTTRNAITTLQRSFSISGENTESTPTLKLERSLVR